MGLPRDRFLAVATGKVLPAGLYGCQAAAVPTSKLRSLRTAIADGVDAAAASNRSVDLTLATLPREADPKVAIVVLRCMAIRRFWFKHPGARPLLEASLDCLFALRHPGVCSGQEAGSEHQTEHEQFGPVSLLACSLVELGMAIDTQWRL
eukprot:356218-Alexandrium_andersonii.AAC.1